MNLTPEFPDKDEDNLPPARRRRARRRMVALLTPDERASFLETVARKTAPTFDFFVFSLLSGLTLGLAFLVDSPYLLVLGALLAPFMAPTVGISLGAILGSVPHFARSLGGLFIGCILVLLAGVGVGLVSRVWLPSSLTQAQFHSQLNWTPLLLVGLGASVSAASLLREEWRSSVASVAVAYALFVPLTAAGLGLGSGFPHLWPDGLVLFAIHLAVGTLCGAATMGAMGYRPLTLFGFSISGAVALLLVLLILGFGGAGAVVGGQIALPTPTFTPTSTLTSTPTITPTPVPPTETPTPSITPTATLTATITLTPTATPVEALVVVGEGFNGAFLRNAPDGNVIGSLFNGSVVVILGETQIGEGSRIWEKVLSLETGQEGWILQNLLLTATPSAPLTSPSPLPTDTPAPTP